MRPLVFGGLLVALIGVSGIALTRFLATPKPLQGVITIRRLQCDSGQAVKRFELLAQNTTSASLRNLEVRLVMRENQSIAQKTINLKNMARGEDIVISEDMAFSGSPEVCFAQFFAGSPSQALVRAIFRPF